MNATAPGLDHYRRLFTPPTRSRGQLDRSTLPAPVRYLSERGLVIGKPRGEWALIRCPVHKGGDEQNPSLGVSLVDGHFRCHACGASGGDIIALHRLVTGKGFRDAVADLGGRFND
jgi:hypothetical protein